eukprot:COSAG02_NODE_7700_length_2886_cov_9.811625_1_plen_379_part_00
MTASSAMRGLLLLRPRSPNGPRVVRRALRLERLGRGGSVVLGSVGVGVVLGATGSEPARAEGCTDSGWTAGAGALALAAVLAVRQIRSNEDDTLQGKIAHAAQDARAAAAKSVKKVVAEVHKAEDRVHGSRGECNVNHQLHAHELGKAIQNTSMEDLIPSRSTMLIAGAFALGFVTGALAFRTRANMVRFRTVDDIPSSYFAEVGTKSSGRAIRGKVASVTDGDTFRIWHKPPLNEPLDKSAGKLSETSLMIRIAAMDTPETKKFGKEGQPFGEEAKQELTRMLEDAGSTLKVRPQARDQFGRAVCLVSVGRWPFEKDVAGLMIEKGLATVYRQGGAQYGGNLARYEELEAAAMKNKTGMWSLGKKLETAAEYKKRTA